MFLARFRAGAYRELTLTEIAGMSAFERECAGIANAAQARELERWIEEEKKRAKRGGGGE